jgi:hypothetical protein
MLNVFRVIFGESGARGVMVARHGRRGMARGELGAGGREARGASV